jgi:hypothetical protein
MTTKVIQLTTDELKDLIGAVVEQKLIELFGDPDQSLILTKTMRSRLVRQKKAVAKGERGESFEAVVGRLGLA